LLFNQKIKPIPMVVFLNEDRFRFITYFKVKWHFNMSVMIYGRFF
jgi:hypothetical protein